MNSMIADSVMNMTLAQISGLSGVVAPVHVLVVALTLHKGGIEK